MLVVGQEPTALLRRMLTCNASMAWQMEKNKHAIRQAIAQFQRHPGDTGSSEVQIAILSERIKYMTSHVQVLRRSDCIP